MNRIYTECKSAGEAYSRKLTPEDKKVAYRDIHIFIDTIRDCIDNDARFRNRVVFYDEIADLETEFETDCFSDIRAEVRDLKDQGFSKKGIAQRTSGIKKRAVNELFKQAKDKLNRSDAYHLLLAFLHRNMPEKTKDMYTSFEHLEIFYSDLPDTMFNKNTEKQQKTNITENLWKEFKALESDKIDAETFMIEHGRVPRISTKENHAYKSYWKIIGFFESLSIRLGNNQLDEALVADYFFGGFMFWRPFFVKYLYDEIYNAVPNIKRLDAFFREHDIHKYRMLDSEMQVHYNKLRNDNGLPPVDFFS